MTTKDYILYNKGVVSVLEQKQYFTIRILVSNGRKLTFENV